MKSVKKSTTTRENEVQKDDINSYLKEIKPALIILRLLGRFPYYFNKSRAVPLSFSLIYFFYSLVIQLVSCFCTYSLNTILWKYIENSRHFDEQMLLILYYVYSLNNFISPIVNWIDAHKLAQYIHRWKDLEDFQMKEGLKLKYIIKFKIWTLILLIGASLLFYYLTECWPLLPSIVSNVVYCQMIWITTLLELKNISEFLLARIIQARSKQELSYLRPTKLLVDQAASRLGEALGNTILLITILNYSCFILCLYCLLQIFVNNATYETQNAFWVLMGAAIIYFFSHFLHCEVAELATRQMGDEFRLKIMKMDLNSMPEECATEINLILLGIQLRPPKIQYNGYITVGTRFITHFLSITVTYLIVLIQFSSDKGKDPVTIFIKDPNSNETIKYKIE